MQRTIRHNINCLGWVEEPWCGGLLSADHRESGNLLRVHRLPSDVVGSGAAVAAGLAARDVAQD